jgi:hypothetical protein
MKHILSIFLVALFLSACQTPSAKNENSNIPATDVSATDAEIPTHNPAHGQPYHDCSIAVGAPLVVKTKSSTTNEVKLNPAHGQPGHRCDLAVGAPLT